MARFMETRLFDSWVHEQDARLALARPGGTGGPASAHGIGQVEAAMGFVVGKKAAAPEGSAVRFEISGEPGDARTFTLAIVNGRALRSAEATPTLTLSMGALDFVRLGCGRTTAAVLSGTGAIGIEGDAELGQRVLDTMNFMF
jgi:uncharacterized protein (TIGR03083 family)